MNLLFGLISFIMLHRSELIGVPLVILIDYLNKDVKSEYAKFFVSMFACFIAALFLKFDSLLYGSPTEALSSWTLIFSQTQIVFKLYFKNSGIRWLFQGLYTPSEKNPSEVTTTPSVKVDPEVIPVVE